MRMALSICFVCVLLAPLQARANQVSEATKRLARQVHALKRLLKQSEQDVQVIKRRIDGMQTGPRVLQGLGIALGGAAAMAGLFGFIATAFGASPSVPWAILGIGGLVWLTRRRAWRAKLPETFTHSDIHASVGDGQTRSTQGRNQPPTRMQDPIAGRFSFTMR